MPDRDATGFPLSPLDLGAGSWGITMGYVVKNVDTSAVEAAARRVINKWRLLAGRLEWSEDLSTWLINIPKEKDASHRVKFTTRRLSVPFSTPITPFSKTSAGITFKPPIDSFRHPSTPTLHSAYASADTPFVSIHVTEYTNCACVGITVPHAVFDAYTGGLVVQYLNAELHGMPWEAPVSSQTNIMRKALNSLATAPSLYAKEPSPLANFRLQFLPYTTKNLVAYAFRRCYEKIFETHEWKGLCLSGNIVRELVGRVKEETKKSGSGNWVSTADILTAWFFKAAFSRENGPATVHITEAVATRSVLAAAKDPAFERYLHNAFIWASLPPLSRDKLAGSLVDLALIHRQTIQSTRNEAYVQAHSHAGPDIMSTLPTSGKGAESCILSNHVVFHLPAINFGSEMHSFWVWVAPAYPDKTFLVFINEFEGGYLIEARMRKDRWEAVAEEIRKMNLECKDSN